MSALDKLAKLLKIDRSAKRMSTAAFMKTEPLFCAQKMTPEQQADFLAAHEYLNAQIEKLKNEYRQQN